MNQCKNCYFIPAVQKCHALAFGSAHGLWNQFVMQGKLRLRLSSLEPNREYCIRLPIAHEGSVTGYVTLKMQVSTSYGGCNCGWSAPALIRQLSLNRTGKISILESSG